MLGVNEIQHGEAQYETDPGRRGGDLGGPVDTGLVDLSGNGALFAQVNGRTSRVLIEWLRA